MEIKSESLENLTIVEFNFAKNFNVQIQKFKKIDFNGFLSFFSNLTVSLKNSEF